MSRNKDTLNTKINPRSGEIMEGNSPFLFLFVDMRFEGETVDAIGLGQVYLMILPLMLVCDF